MYAVTPNPQWATGKVSYEPVSSVITVTLDDGEVIKGTLDSTTCSEIKWTPIDDENASMSVIIIACDFRYRIP